jgi:hypothetical protein
VDRELEKLENELAAIKAKINQAIGQRDSILKRMNADFGVSTIEEAKAKIVELEALEAASRAKFEELKAEYEALCE